MPPLAVVARTELCCNVCYNKNKEKSAILDNGDSCAPTARALRSGRSLCALWLCGEKIGACYFLLQGRQVALRNSVVKKLFSHFWVESVAEGIADEGDGDKKRGEHQCWRPQ